MPFTTITPPTVLPVTTGETMAHTIVEDADEFDLIEQYIKAFTSHGQHITGRQFVEATFELDLDAFPSGNIDLKPLLQSVAYITYLDGDGALQTLSTDDYTVKTTALVGYIEPVTSWPTDVYDSADIKVRFNAGYSVTLGKSTTPEDIKAWIMVRVAGLYEQRANFVLSKGGRFGVASMPRDFIDSVIDDYIVPGEGSGV